MKEMLMLPKSRYIYIERDLFCVLKENLYLLHHLINAALFDFIQSPGIRQIKRDIVFAASLYL